MSAVGAVVDVPCRADVQRFQIPGQGACEGQTAKVIAKVPSSGLADIGGGWTIRLRCETCGRDFTVTY